MGKKHKLLIDSKQLLMVQTQLAALIGLNEAIALQQIHYWVDANALQAKKTHHRDGYWWCYNTWKEWNERDFPFWSVSTIRRVFNTLASTGLIITRPHENNKSGLWVTVNYGQLELLQKQGGKTVQVNRPGNRYPVQNEQPTLSKMNRVSVQNEQGTSNTETTENTTDIKNIFASDDAAVEKPQKQRAANPIFDAVALHVFGIQAGQVNGAGSRVGIIAAWLAGKSEKVGTRKIGFIPDPCTDPEQVRQFVAWYKRKLPGASVPRDLAKFSEYWLQWRSTNTGAALPKPFVNILEPLYELTKEEDERAWNGGGWKRDE